MEIGRRTFLGQAAGILAASTLPGCASAAVTRVSSSDGRVRIPLRDHPALAAPGGFLRVEPLGAGTGVIYVLLRDDGSFAAVSPICTHLGCTVNIEGTHLVCPCHGSTYERDGRVVRGPAQRDLTSFPTSLSGTDVLVISLESEP